MNILGLMSGSSLDGIDMAICSFSGNPHSSDFRFEMKATQLVEFPDPILNQLKEVNRLSAVPLLELHSKFGSFLGEQALQFIKTTNFPVAYIASHGHTVFHFPEKRFTFQLGHGASIASSSKIDTICDFRSSDIASQGSGAPFAPIADRLLYPNVDILVNLGGISNFSFKDDDYMEAYDISPCNQILNHLAQKTGRAYDEGGSIAREGAFLPEFFQELVALNALHYPGARALDNTWVQNNFFPIIDKIETIEDAMRTCVEFIVSELKKALNWLKLRPGLRVGFSGGGSFNKFMMKVIKKTCFELGLALVDFTDEIINFKEAGLMALLGYLRVNDIGFGINQVTGAKEDTIGGCIYKAV